LKKCSKKAHIPYILAGHLQNADPDPDPAYYFDADADPDPAYHFDADAQHWTAVLLIHIAVLTSETLAFLV
jgi:hypothetical protein